MKHLLDFITETESAIDLLNDADKALEVHNSLYDLSNQIRKWRPTVPSFQHDEFPQFLDAGLEELECEVSRLSDLALKMHSYLKGIDEEDEQYGTYETQTRRTYQWGVL